METVGYLVGIILVVCQAVKVAGVAGKYIPILAVVLGIVGAMYFDGANFLAVASGVLIGLATSGAFGAVKGLMK